MQNKRTSLDFNTNHSKKCMTELALLSVLKERAHLTGCHVQAKKFS